MGPFGGHFGTREHGLWAWGKGVPTQWLWGPSICVADELLSAAHTVRSRTSNHGSSLPSRGDLLEVQPARPHPGAALCCGSATLCFQHAPQLFRVFAKLQNCALACVCLLVLPSQSPGRGSETQPVPGPEAGLEITAPNLALLSVRAPSGPAALPGAHHQLEQKQKAEQKCRLPSPPPPPAPHGPPLSGFPVRELREAADRTSLVSRWIPQA